MYLKPIPSPWDWVMGFCDWPGLDHVTTAVTGADPVSERGDVAPTCKLKYSFQRRGNRWLTNKIYRCLLFFFGLEQATHWLRLSVWDPETFVCFGGNFASTTGTPIFHLFSDFLMPLPVLPPYPLSLFLCLPGSQCPAVGVHLSWHCFVLSSDL